jgi:xylulose-5-phosphate/fructose-6-phosphate phosphoketolase
MPAYTRDRAGLHGLISKFSVPGGFPSHINAETPGAIHEGGTSIFICIFIYPSHPLHHFVGELGYALSVAFGAVMDNPDLIAVCVVGDGEAETGSTATYAF